MSTYSRLFDTLLARMDAETAHRAAISGLRTAARVPGAAAQTWRRRTPSGERLGVETLGRHFPGRLGVAAGFDKNAVCIDALGALGFAFVEVGTVTARPQPGNARPRLHRLVADQAIVNRMGFNNDGAAAVAARLARRRRRRSALPVVVGVNIGKSKVVPEQHAVADYEASTRLLAPYADYLVVNVSSPNTPGLRNLQAVEQLRPLLTAVRRQADQAAAHHVPLLVKIAPDLGDDDVRDIAELAVELGLDGIVATNTTTSRTGLASPAADVAAAGAGGLSGPPLRPRALEVLRILRAAGGERLVLVAAGGITTAEDARERMAAGATLLQAYTGFVYGGPAWPARIQRELGVLSEDDA